MILVLLSGAWCPFLFCNVLGGVVVLLWLSSLCLADVSFPHGAVYLSAVGYCRILRYDTHLHYNISGKQDVVIIE